MRLKSTRVRRVRRVEPLFLTPSIMRTRRREFLLRVQWFALGIAATTFVLGTQLPGFYSSAGLMFVVALFVGAAKKFDWEEETDGIHSNPAPAIESGTRSSAR